jgi:hypothetical protein
MVLPTATRSYVVEWNDTIAGIAYRLTGDAADWPVLAQYNALTYPYVSNDPPAPSAASGTVTFTVPSNSGAWSVPTGFLVARPPLPNGQYSVQYATTSEASAPSGTLSLTVPVACVAVGPIGNCQGGAISVVVSSGLPSGVTVANAAPLVNGTAPNVAGPGTVLLVPPSFSASLPTPQPLTSWLDTLGGTSLLLGPGDLLVDSRGSLVLATGADSLLQNWALRVQTQQGELPMSPQTGSEALSLATSGSPSAQDLVRVSCAQAVLADPRAAAVQAVGLAQQGTSLSLTLQVTPIGQGQPLTVTTTLPAA